MRDLVEATFQALISAEDVDIIDGDGELQIAGDAWTLVLEGDPLSSVMIALDDEIGNASQLLQQAMSEDAFAAIRDLDCQVGGRIVELLTGSPDPLAQTLANILTA